MIFQYDCFTQIDRIDDDVSVTKGCKSECNDVNDDNRIIQCCEGNLCNDKFIPQGMYLTQSVVIVSIEDYGFISWFEAE